MRKIVAHKIFSIFLLFIVAQPAYAFLVPASEQSAQIVADTTNVEIAVTDERIVKLQTYLEFQNSPLVEQAAIFVKKADEYQLFDWRLVPAITGVESTFGKAIPDGSYNAYGWGNGTIVFRSWEDSIDVVTKALKKKYVDRGLDTVEKIAGVYAPSSTTWANKVLWFMNQIATAVPKKSSQLDLSF